jgi:stage II sporulation protein AA (anti-sigma F factor antagonist)
MYATDEMMEIERQGDTLILTPLGDLRELYCQEIEAEREQVQRHLEAEPSIRGVVVDFGKTDYFGSTALGLLVWLRHEMRVRGGRMALCNLSAHEQDIVEVTGTDVLWTVYPSREEAVAAVSDSARAA